MFIQHVDRHGFKLLGAQYKTGLLDIPPPWTLWKQYQMNGRVDDDVVLRAVWPFMLFIGIGLLWMLVAHLRLIGRGYTTVENISRPPDDLDNVKNPFDCGGLRQNLKRILGTSILRLLIPLPPDRHLVET